MISPKFIIKDWAGNTCFNARQFNSSENAWHFLYLKFPDDDLKDSNNQDLQEYFVERIKITSCLK